MADLWRAGDAVALASSRPEVPIALVYSPADELVPSRFSEEFAAAARRGGHLVTVHVIRNAGHHDLYAPRTVAEMLADWISAL